MSGSQCTAQSKRSGERCKRRPHPGVSVCHVHGAGSAKVQAAAKRRRDRDRARALIGALLHDSDAEAITDPYAELLRLGGVLRNAANVAGERLNALDSIRNLDDKGSEQLRSEAVLWREIVTMSQRTLVDIARLDIEDRHLRLEAAKVAAILTVLEDGMRAAALDDGQAYRFRQAVRDGLNALEAGR